MRTTNVEGSKAAAVTALESEDLFVTEWTDVPRAVYAEHSHPGREVRVVLEGSMTIGGPAERHELGPGDRLDLDPGEPHWARVGPGGVAYLAGSSTLAGYIEQMNEDSAHEAE